MNQVGKRVTLQTIADRLGVSRTTVSNAFSRPDQLSEVLRTRVFDAARELGYAGPDPAARSLRAGTAGAVGVLLPQSLTYTLTDPYASTILRGLAQVIDARDVSLLLVPVCRTRPQDEAVRQAVVDAFFIYTMPEGHPVTDIALRRGVPVVIVDSPQLDEHPFVGTDDYAAGREIVEHLLANGKRRLGVVTYQIGNEKSAEVDETIIATGTYRNAVERLRGMLDAVEGAGLPRSGVRLMVRHNEPEGGRDAAAALLDGPDPPDAIVCLSDPFAAGALEEATARGLAVPGDVAVTGWDDTVVAHDLGLTSMRQPDEEKARIAAEWLLDGVSGPRRRILATQLVVRATTA